MECGKPAADPGAAASAVGEVSAKSPLDKPLAELTEEDIAQLTREDCRRFLKTKGMRRPSWNKGQAIQQVISLKALIEGRPGCGDCPAGGGILRKPPSELESRPQFRDSPPGVHKDSGGGPSCSGQQSPTNEPSPYRRRDPIPPALPPPPSSSGDPAYRTGRSYPPRPPGSRFLFSRVTAEPPAAQMTVFYDGRVNVYDGVSVDQARAIMELAADPACFDEPSGPIVPPPPRRPPPVFRLPGAGPFVPAPLFARSFPIPAADRAPHLVAEDMEERRVPQETEPEGSTSRRASLQRYLDKRKDRFKGKKILGEPTSSDIEMMDVSNKLNCVTPRAIPNLNDTSISALPEPPQSLARCSSSTREKVFIDLNDDGNGN